MNEADIDRIAGIRMAGGHTTIPMPISEWREIQLARIGKATVRDGKIKPVDKASVSQKIARKAKADRIEKGLRANREKKR